jgi:hypothetical protein
MDSSAIETEYTLCYNQAVILYHPQSDVKDSHTFFMSLSSNTSK